MITIIFGLLLTPIDATTSQVTNGQFQLSGNALTAGERRRRIACLFRGSWQRDDHSFVSMRSENVCRVAAETDTVGRSLGVLNGFMVVGGSLWSEGRLVASFDEELQSWRINGSDEGWSRITFLSLSADALPRPPSQDGMEQNGVGHLSRASQA